MFKNIARFYKNPLGYLYWRVVSLDVQGRWRITWALLAYHLIQTTLVYTHVRASKEGMLGKWRFVIGERNREQDAPHRDRRMPSDRKKNYVRYSNFHQKLKNKRNNSMWFNWWCRDQVFRKYFEMRKKNGIKPSYSGFYHESINKEYRQKVDAQFQIKAERRSI